MKQEEAKTKWCPMARYSVSASDENASNRWPKSENPESCRCIASDCMMWLWLSKEEGLGCCGLAKA